MWSLAQKVCFESLAALYHALGAMRDQLAAVSQAAGAIVFSLVLALRWVHATFIAPVGSFVADGLLPIYEETCKAVVREWFAVLNRNINTASAFLLSLLSGRSYRRTAARNAAEKQQAWHRWYRSARGTFNALIEQEGLSGASGAGNEDGGGSFSSSPLPSPASSFRQRGAPARGASGVGSSSSGSSTAAAAAKGSGGGSSRWSFWHRRSGSSGGGLDEVAPSTPTGRSDLRRGSVLFELPSGFAVAQMTSGRGLLEDLRVGAEVALGRAFGAVRRGLHRVLWLDAGSAGSSDRDSRPADLLARSLRRATPPPGMPAVAEEGQAEGAAEASAAAAAGTSAETLRRGRRSGRRPPLKSLLRSGRHWEEDLSVWTASDVILREGYPLEQHSVTTPDGFLLQMHRIPRHGARDVAFFQHGVLDTSLGWVSNGVVGSAAFAAYDAGFDVWLANSRSNAPRLHIDGERQGSRYWHYTMNELSLFDISAEITHIHNTKMAELSTPGRHSAASQEGPLEAAPQLRRAATDSVLDALRWVDVHSSNSRGDLEQGAPADAARQQQGESGFSSESTAAAGAGAAAAQPGGSSRGGGEAGGAQQPPIEQQGQQQGQQGSYWWQRLTGRRGSQGQGDLAYAHVERGATSLRRSQSASEPLQQAQQGQQGVPHVAVPISARSMKRQASSLNSGGGGAAGAGGGAGNAAQEVLPYRLQAVGHSLGAATLIVYAVVCRMRGQPHRLRRLVLMSPAGFHPRMPLGLLPCKWLFPPLVWLLDRVPGLRGRGMGLRLPSPLLRYIAFKFTMDLRHMPALHDLVKSFMKMMLSGDSSQWDAALQMPHYSTYSMPALSLHCGAHFAQWARDLSFRLFDYGTAAANQEHYGTDRPPSIADHYRLLDIPVDLLAGAADGIIPPACAVMHAQRLRAAGVPCSFRILPYGHMDFTFAVKEDIRLFVLSKLSNPL